MNINSTMLANAKVLLILCVRTGKLLKKSKNANCFNTVNAISYKSLYRLKINLSPPLKNV